MLIEVWSDVACPFCFVGKKRLETALAQFPHKDVDVVYKSFMLNPQLETNPDISIADYLAESKGLDPRMVQQMNQRVSQMGAAEGIDFVFDKVVVANTERAHRLLQHAQGLGKGAEAQERIFRAYFSEGSNIDDVETLLGLAIDLGVDAENARAAIESDAVSYDVQRDIAEARSLGITGVPFFVIDRAYGVSGAQEVAVFEQALNKALTEPVVSRD
jgi:predicted DsbA family dithiol-disulfide isomerase